MPSKTSQHNSIGAMSCEDKDTLKQGQGCERDGRPLGTGEIPCLLPSLVTGAKVFSLWLHSGGWMRTIGEDSLDSLEKVDFCHETAFLKPSKNLTKNS